MYFTFYQALYFRMPIYEGLRFGYLKSVAGYIGGIKLRLELPNSASSEVQIKKHT